MGFSLKSIERTVQHAAAGVVKHVPIAGDAAAKWLDDPRRITPPSKSKARNGPAAAADAPSSASTATADRTVETPKYDNTTTLGFTASWATFVVLFLGGMLVGMIWRKKY